MSPGADAADGPERRWARRKEARPGEIVAAALDCFAERGFAGTRLDDVAARAGVTKGTLYLYFPNKEELFKAVIREALVPLLERAAGEPLAAAGDPAERIRRVLQLLAGGVLGSPLGAIPKLVICESGNFPEIARFYVEEVASRGRALLTATIREGIERGRFRPVDPELVVYSLIAPLLLAALWQRSLGPHDDRPLDAEAMIRQHLDLFLRGLAPESPADGREARSP